MEEAVSFCTWFCLLQYEQFIQLCASYVLFPNNSGSMKVLKFRSKFYAPSFFLEEADRKLVLQYNAPFVANFSAFLNTEKWSKIPNKARV